MIWYIVIGSVLLVGGLLVGYWTASARMSSRSTYLDKKEQSIRRARIQIQRQRYQESTSRIHRFAEDDKDESAFLRDELEQKYLEIALLKEDSKLETLMLRDEVNDLKKRLKRIEGIDASFRDEQVPSVVGSSESKEDALKEEAQEDDSAIEAASENVVEENVVEYNVVEDNVVEDNVVEAEPATTESGSGEKQEEEAPVQKAPASVAADLKDKAADVPEVEEVAEDAQELKEETASLIHAQEESKPQAKDASDEVEQEFTHEFPDVAESETERDIQRLSDSVAEHVPNAENESGSDLKFHWEAVPRRGSRTRRFKRSELDLSSMAAERMSSSSSSGAQIDATPQPQKEAAAPVTKPAVGRTSDLPQFKSLDQVIEELFSESLEGPKEESNENLVLIREIVKISDEQFSLLQELGYASLKRLSNLSSSEVRRLSDLFAVSAAQIEQSWVPTARAHLNLMNQ